MKVKWKMPGLKLLLEGISDLDFKQARNKVLSHLNLKYVEICLAATVIPINYLLVPLFFLLKIVLTTFGPYLHRNFKISLPSSF